MSAPLVIENVRIIDPVDGFDEVGSILVSDGVIKARGRSHKIKDINSINGEGLIASPGFIDLHCHLREPGFEDKETIASGTRAAARGGFTALCCMPNTFPAIDNVSTVRFIQEAAHAAGSIRVFPIGSVTRSRAGTELSDMEELADAGVVAFSDDGNPVADGHIMRMALIYAKDLGLPIIDHCEDRLIAKNPTETSGQGLGINEGWVSLRMGLPGYPGSAEESIVARDIALAESTGGRFHAAHISTKGSVELIRAARERGALITGEATPHHLTMTEEWVLGNNGAHGGSLTKMAYDTNAKMSPPLRTDLDRQALIEALRDGTISAVATDHAPHTFADKAVTFQDASNGISVLETAFGSLMALVHSGQIELTTLLFRLTIGPASVIGIGQRGLGTIREGSPADLVLFDPNEEWIVDPATFASKGQNTPLKGATLTGKIKFTIAKGEIVYDELSARQDTQSPNKKGS